MNLFGRRWDPAALRTRVGRMAQVAGATRLVLADGAERGVEAIDVRTGAGFRFLVLPSRGLDIADAEYDGLPLAWRSSTGRVHPAFYEPRGTGWLRGFCGGLMVTCGYGNVGVPSVDGGVEYGQHGRASYIPAEQVAVTEGWEGERYRITVRGAMRETAVFGDHLVVRRTISTELGATALRIDDDIENAGSEAAALMLPYHVNLGFPLLDDGAEVVTPSMEVRPRDADAAPGLGEYSRVHSPRNGYHEQVFYHQMAVGPDGIVEAGLVNRRLRGGLGVALRYDKRLLPRFIQWKMLGEGMYVMGLEPANCLVEGRAAERARGTLQFLQPGERRALWLEIAVLAGDAVTAFAERVGELRKA